MVEFVERSLKNGTTAVPNTPKIPPKNKGNSNWPLNCTPTS
jgi:hypothetical protein